MYVDNNLLFSDSQDLAQVAGSYYSTNVLNLGSATDIGVGRACSLVIVVDEAFTSGGSATVKFEVIDEADTTLDGRSVVIASTRAIAIATLSAGKVITLPIPAGVITQQYVGVKYTIGTATTTAGTVSAFLALEADHNPN